MRAWVREVSGTALSECAALSGRKEGRHATPRHATPPFLSPALEPAQGRASGSQPLGRPAAFLQRPRAGTGGSAESARGPRVCAPPGRPATSRGRRGTRAAPARRLRPAGRLPGPAEPRLAAGGRARSPKPARGCSGPAPRSHVRARRPAPRRRRGRPRRWVQPRAGKRLRAAGRARALAGATPPRPAARPSPPSPPGSGPGDAGKATRSAPDLARGGHSGGHGEPGVPAGKEKGRPVGGRSESFRGLSQAGAASSWQTFQGAGRLEMAGRVESSRVESGRGGRGRGWGACAAGRRGEGRGLDLAEAKVSRSPRTPRGQRVRKLGELRAQPSGTRCEGS